jgi:hypothetical protein
MYMMIMLLSSSCGDGGYGFDNSVISTEESYLLVSQDEFLVQSSDEDFFTFNVKCKNVSWEFVNVPDWITIQPLSGNSDMNIELRVKSNPSANADRQCSISLKSVQGKNYSVELTVSQLAAEPFIQISDETVVFGDGILNKDVFVSSNCDWSISSNVDWLSLSKDANNGIISIAARENYIKKIRTGEIVFHYAKNELGTISVSQTRDTLRFDCDGGSFELPEKLVFTNEWTLSCFYKLSASVNDAISTNFIDHEKYSAGEYALEVRTTKNQDKHDLIGGVDIRERQEMSGPYYVPTFSTVAEIIVKQKGRYVYFSPSNAFCSSAGDKIEVHVISSTEWIITSCPDWIKLSKDFGLFPENYESTTSILLDIEPNNTGITRQGEIVICEGHKSGSSSSYHPYYSSTFVVTQY